MLDAIASRRQVRFSVVELVGNVARVDLLVFGAHRDPLQIGDGIFESGGGNAQDDARRKTSFRRFREIEIVDLAVAVISPKQPKFARPRRALPWTDVQRLLRSVDTSTPSGRRDHALLLMMSTYGFGAGEVIQLELQDIDWIATTLKVVRPKTGVAFTLPLLPAVARALALWLRDGRPPSTPTRHVFVRMKMPFTPP